MDNKKILKIYDKGLYVERPSDLGKEFKLNRRQKNSLIILMVAFLFVLSSLFIKHTLYIAIAKLFFIILIFIWFVLWIAPEMVFTFKEIFAPKKVVGNIIGQDINSEINFINEIIATLSIDEIEYLKEKFTYEESKHARNIHILKFFDKNNIVYKSLAFLGLFLWIKQPAITEKFNEIAIYIGTLFFGLLIGIICTELGFERIRWMKFCLLIAEKNKSNNHLKA